MDGGGVREQEGRGGRGSGLQRSQKRGLEMNMQILAGVRQKQQPGSAVLLLLRARASCVRVRACTLIGMGRAGLCGPQISFEWLIWTKVAQEAGRTAILFAKSRRTSRRRSGKTDRRLESTLS